MKSHSFLVGVVAAALSLPTAALAARLDNNAGTKVSADVGLNSYTGSIGDVTGMGPAWGVQVDTAPNSVFGLEFAYQGSRNPIDDLRVGSGAAVWRNGISAALKVEPLRTMLSPYIGAGIGESYFNVNDQGTGLYGNDFATEIPLMAGVDFNVRGLEAGVRGTYRPLLGDNFAPGMNGNLMGASVQLGGQF